MRGALAFAIPVLLLLAGCSGPAESTGPAAGSDEFPMLQGYIVDSGVRPVVGAKVTIASANATATSGNDGRFAFPSLPAQVPLVVVVEAKGFLPRGKAVSVSVGNSTLLNFTLDPVPSSKPYAVSQKFKGFIVCEADVETSGGADVRDCSSVQGVNTGVSQRVAEFQVNGDLAGVVLETSWAPRTPLAQYLNATVETVGFGDKDTLLAAAQGGSILRVVVGQAASKKYYSGGGTVRVTWSVGANLDELEAGAGAAFAFDQDFEAIFTAFYLQPPDPNFTAAGP